MALLGRWCFLAALATIPITNAYEHKRTARYDLRSIGEYEHLLTKALEYHATPADIRKPEDRSSLDDMVDALDVMQKEYFLLWTGIWPTAIDWTSAVMSTHLSAALLSLSSSLDYSIVSDETVSAEALSHENNINGYFMQLVSFYFGQDAFSLRQQAYDDRLWVVLGWLEAIKFINHHSDSHYSEYHTASWDRAWHGKQWLPAFAHRARIFWELAAEGWNTTLCGGGMLWSPSTSPYKNAITNELFISASIGMYLQFPGDDNKEPFLALADGTSGAHDPKYLQAAIDGYRWLTLSNMTDAKGLYVDGFHISGWEQNPKKPLTNTKCDVKNEMVYTYNQGVILTGQRGLYEATAARSYLEDGHKLVKNIINATGWDLKHDRVYDGQEYGKQNDSRYIVIPEWQGLGRAGIVEEACDSQGTCSQDGQTFKGILFHHLAKFCEPLSRDLMVADDMTMFDDTKAWHEQQCKRYTGWVKNNAKYALKTKDDEGKFGMWWGAGALTKQSIQDNVPENNLPVGAVDYRNLGVPQSPLWQGAPLLKASTQQSTSITPPKPRVQQPVSSMKKRKTSDLNDRSRGRTVETQSGGIAVMRALWMFSNLK